MERLVSLAHLSLLDVSPPELVSLAADAGFSAVGLRLSPADRDDKPYPLVHDVALLRETRRRMRTTGVVVLDVEVVCLDDIDVGALIPVLDTAAQLEARYLVTNSRCGDPGRLVEPFGELCSEAVPRGIRPVLEFMSYGGIRSLAAAVQVAAATTGGVLIDALHLHRTGGDAAHLASVDPVLLPYVQLCDASRIGPSGGSAELVHESRHARLPPGQGELALDELISALPAEAPVSVEAPSDALRARHGDARFARRLRLGTETVLTHAGG